MGENHSGTPNAFLRRNSWWRRGVLAAVTTITNAIIFTATAVSVALAICHVSKRWKTLRSPAALLSSDVCRDLWSVTEVGVLEGGRRGG